MQSRAKTVFITGASKGLGLILTNKFLERGFNVASTSRDAEQLKKVVHAGLVREDNFLALGIADLSDREAVKRAVELTVEKFKAIDILINNAGYSQLGAFEELTEKEIDDIFDCNVYGVINVTRCILPYLRANKDFAEGPRIVNISSIGGLYGQVQGVGTYISSKFAVDGFSEALGEELREFGIKVVVVNPGNLRTMFIDTIKTASQPMAEYPTIRQIEKAVQSFNGLQPGNPLLAADAIIDVAALSSNPPLHLILGSDAVEMAKKRIETLQRDLEAYQQLAVSIDYRA